MQPSRQHTKALSAMHSTKQSDYLPWKSRFLERLNLGRNALPVIRPVYAFACFLLCGSNVTCRQGISKSSGEPTRHGVKISSALQMAITRQGISQKSLEENHSSCLEKDVLDFFKPPSVTPFVQIPEHVGISLPIESVFRGFFFSSSIVNNANSAIPTSLYQFDSI